MTPRGGATPQQQGRTFEQLLEWQCRQYNGQGKAAIYHNRIAGDFVGEGKFIPDPSLARPDFSGTLKGGRGIHFDAKTTENPTSWQLPREQQHQYFDLLDQAVMGAIAFFLVECRPLRSVFLLRVHPDIPVPLGRPKAAFAEIQMQDFFLEATSPNQRITSIAHTAAFGVEADAGNIYDWLTPMLDIWLGPDTLRTNRMFVGRMRGEQKEKRDAEIRRLCAGGVSRGVLAQRFHLDYCTVKGICNGLEPSAPGMRKSKKPTINRVNHRAKSAPPPIAGVHVGHFAKRMREDE